jgi:hypothetical protein
MMITGANATHCGGHVNQVMHVTTKRPFIGTPSFLPYRLSKRCRWNAPKDLLIAKASLVFFVLSSPLQ